MLWIWASESSARSLAARLREPLLWVLKMSSFVLDEVRAGREGLDEEEVLAPDISEESCDVKDRVVLELISLFAFLERATGAPYRAESLADVFA